MLCEPYRSSVYDSRNGNSHRERHKSGRGSRDGDDRGGGGPREFSGNGSHPGPRGAFDDRQGRRGGARDSRRRQQQHGGPRAPPSKPPPPGFGPQEPLLDGHAVV